MWIRSQDGTILMDCDFFAIEDHGGKYEVITLSGKSGISISLGTYTTKGKALAVLNDIQEFYECSYYETFQMPQDEDVEV
jgi:hypothetical protein